MSGFNRRAAYAPPDPEEERIRAAYERVFNGGGDQVDGATVLVDICDMAGLMRPRASMVDGNETLSEAAIVRLAHQDLAQRILQKANAGFAMQMRRVEEPKQRQRYSDDDTPGDDPANREG